MRRYWTMIGLVLLAPLANACTGTDALNLAPQPDGGIAAAQTETLEGTSSSSPTSAGADNAEATTSNQAEEERTAAAVTGDARIEFAPVIGATPEAVSPLSSRLSQRARQRGIATTQGGGATHVVKGYFSAIADGNQTTVIYVWDVLDPSGNRLHRIQGQQEVAGGKGDGWSSVTGETMERIADRTIDELALWLSKSTG